MRGAKFATTGGRSGRVIAVLTAVGALFAAAIAPSTALAAGGWSAPVPVSSGFAAVSISCASTAFCVAVDPEAALVYNGTAWTGGTSSIDSTGDIDSVSCASSTFCIAVDDAGRALSFNGTGWTTPAAIDGTGFLDSVSCASATFCVAVDTAGNALSFNGSSWTGPTAADAGSGLDSVSCPSSGFCLAVDSAGRALTRSGSGWATPADIDGTNVLSSVSCTSASFCAAVDLEGNALSFNGSSWTPVNADPGVNIPFGVSCASPSFCTAIDTAGNAFVYNGANWTTPVAIDPSPNSKLFGVSCPSTTFCASVDSNGNALTYSVAGVPVGVTPPTISGSAVQGGTLTEAHGNWTNSPIAYAYQWTDCDGSGDSCAPIAGATGQTYLLGAADVGHTIRVVETAGNGAGAGTATVSTATGLVGAAPAGGTVPVNTAAPSITGSRAIGRVVACSTGSWGGTTPQTYAYQWLRNATPITGATGRTRRVTTTDDGTTLTCRVTAKNVAGSASATSAGATIPIASTTKRGTAQVGRVTVRGTAAGVLLSCRGSAGQSCTITLRMTVSERLHSGRLVGLSASTRTTRRTVTVGSRTVRLTAGRSEGVRVRLSAAGRHLLAGHHRLAVRFAASRRSGTGSMIRISSQTITFKATAT